MTDLDARLRDAFDELAHPAGSAGVMDVIRERRGPDDSGPDSGGPSDAPADG